MVRRIDDDRTGQFAGRVLDDLPIVFRVNLFDRNSRDLMAIVECGCIHHSRVGEAGTGTE